MRRKLLILARKIAHVFEWVIRSKSAVDTAESLNELLPPARLWALSVILASWQLSKPESTRSELAALLKGTGVPLMWPNLDLFERQLTSFIVAAYDAQTIAEQAEAAMRLIEAVQKLSVRLLRSVIQSKTFLNAAKLINRDFPELEPEEINMNAPIGFPTDIYRGNKEKDKPVAKKTIGSATPRVWTAADGELEQLATDYLLFLGWTRAKVEYFLGGKTAGKEV